MQPDAGLPYAEVIGDPIAHSKSPHIHGHWLSDLCIAADYRATRVQADELAEFLKSRRSDPNWRGCNVTIPHKEAVLRHLDRVDERASIIGAVNTVVRTSQGLIGYNTDADGIAAALKFVSITGRKAALIGGGGAARAALTHLADRGASDIALLVRDTSKAQQLRAIIPGKLLIGCFEDAHCLLKDAAVIINASPLGMTGCPEMPRKLLAAVAAQSTATLFDMVYLPVKTSFLSAAQGPAINGVTMLVGQARRAFELFYGATPPTSDLSVRDLLAEDVRKAAKRSGP